MLASIGGHRTVAPVTSYAPAVGTVDPATVGQVPPVYRAVGSFVLVLAFGTAVLYRSQRFVEGAVDASMDRPLLSLVYGLIAYGLVAFLGFLALTQLSLAGVVGPPITAVAAALVAAGMLGLAGLGYAVVGTRLVELLDGRQVWTGLVFGAVLSASSWLLLPPLAGAMLWTGLAAVGVGGPVREWMHGAYGTEPDELP